MIQRLIRSHASRKWAMQATGVMAPDLADQNLLRSILLLPASA
jgi:hypothetical protein